MSKKTQPRHGVTGCSVGPEEVAVFMDYITDQTPTTGLVHQGVAETENRSTRDADVYFIDHQAERIYKILNKVGNTVNKYFNCLLYTSPSPRDQRGSRMPSSA